MIVREVYEDKKTYIVVINSISGGRKTTKMAKAKYAFAID